MKKRKQLLSILLILSMLVSCIPGVAFAEDGTDWTWTKMESGYPDEIKPWDENATYVVYKFIPGTTGYYEVYGDFTKTVPEDSWDYSIVVNAIHPEHGRDYVNYNTIVSAGGVYDQGKYQLTMVDTNDKHEKYPVEFAAGEEYFVVLEYEGLTLDSVNLKQLDVKNVKIASVPGGRVYERESYRNWERNQSKVTKPTPMTSTQIWSGTVSTSSVFVVETNEGYTFEYMAVGNPRDGYTKASFWNDTSKVGFIEPYMNANQIADGAVLTPIFSGGDYEEQLFFIDAENVSDYNAENHTAEVEWLYPYNQHGVVISGEEPEVVFEGYVGYVLSGPGGDWDNDTVVTMQLLPADAVKAIRDGEAVAGAVAAKSDENDCLMTITVSEAGDYFIEGTDPAGVRVFNKQIWIEVDADEPEEPGEGPVPGQLYFVSADDVWAYDQMCGEIEFDESELRGLEGSPAHLTVADECFVVFVEMLADGTWVAVDHVSLTSDCDFDFAKVEATEEHTYPVYSVTAYNTGELEASAVSAQEGAAEITMTITSEFPGLSFYSKAELSADSILGNKLDWNGVEEDAKTVYLIVKEMCGTYEDVEFEIEGTTLLNSDSFTYIKTLTENEWDYYVFEVSLPKTLLGQEFYIEATDRGAHEEGIEPCGRGSNFYSNAVLMAADKELDITLPIEDLEEDLDSYLSLSDKQTVTRYLYLAGCDYENHGPVLHYIVPVTSKNNLHVRFRVDESTNGPIWLEKDDKIDLEAPGLEVSLIEGNKFEITSDFGDNDAIEDGLKQGYDIRIGDSGNLWIEMDRPHAELVFSDKADLVDWDLTDEDIRKKAGNEMGSWLEIMESNTAPVEKYAYLAYYSTSDGNDWEKLIDIEAVEITDDTQWDIQYFTGFDEEDKAVYSTASGLAVTAKEGHLYTFTFLEKEDDMMADPDRDDEYGYRIMAGGDYSHAWDAFVALTDGIHTELNFSSKMLDLENLELEEAKAALLSGINVPDGKTVEVYLYIAEYAFNGYNDRGHEMYKLVGVKEAVSPDAAFRADYETPDGWVKYAPTEANGGDLVVKNLGGNKFSISYNQKNDVFANEPGYGLELWDAEHNRGTDTWNGWIGTEKPKSQVFFINAEDAVYDAKTHTVTTTWGPIYNGTEVDLSETEPAFEGYIGYVIDGPEGEWENDDVITVKVLPVTAFGMLDEDGDLVPGAVTAKSATDPYLITIMLKESGRYVLKTTDPDGLYEFDDNTHINVKPAAGENAVPGELYAVYDFDITFYDPITKEVELDSEAWVMGEGCDTCEPVIVHGDCFAFIERLADGTWRLVEDVTLVPVGMTDAKLRFEKNTDQWEYPVYEVVPHAEGSYIAKGKDANGREITLDMTSTYPNMAFFTSPEMKPDNMLPNDLIWQESYGEEKVVYLITEGLCGDAGTWTMLVKGTTGLTPADFAYKDKLGKGDDAHYVYKVTLTKDMLGQKMKIEFTDEVAHDFNGNCHMSNTFYINGCLAMADYELDLDKPIAELAEKLYGGFGIEDGDSVTRYLYLAAYDYIDGRDVLTAITPYTKQASLNIRFLVNDGEDGMEWLQKEDGTIDNAAPGLEVNQIEGNQFEIKANFGLNDDIDPNNDAQGYSVFAGESGNMWIEMAGDEPEAGPHCEWVFSDMPGLDKLILDTEANREVVLKSISLSMEIDGKAAASFGKYMYIAYYDEVGELTKIEPVFITEETPWNLSHFAGYDDEDYPIFNPAENLTVTPKEGNLFIFTYTGEPDKDMVEDWDGDMAYYVTQAGDFGDAWEAYIILNMNQEDESHCEWVFSDMPGLDKLILDTEANREVVLKSISLSMYIDGNKASSFDKYMYIAYYDEDGELTKIEPVVITTEHPWDLCHFAGYDDEENRIFNPAENLTVTQKEGNLFNFAYIGEPDKDMVEDWDGDMAYYVAQKGDFGDAWEAYIILDMNMKPEFEPKPGYLYAVYEGDVADYDPETGELFIQGEMIMGEGGRVCRPTMVLGDYFVFMEYIEDKDGGHWILVDNVTLKSVDTVDERLIFEGGETSRGYTCYTVAPYEEGTYQASAVGKNGKKLTLKMSSRYPSLGLYSDFVITPDALLGYEVNWTREMGDSYDVYLITEALHGDVSEWNIDTDGIDTGDIVYMHPLVYNDIEYHVYHLTLTKDMLDTSFGVAFTDGNCHEEGEEECCESARIWINRAAGYQEYVMESDLLVQDDNSKQWQYDASAGDEAAKDIAVTLPTKLFDAEEGKIDVKEDSALEIKTDIAKIEFDAPVLQQIAAVEEDVVLTVTELKEGDKAYDFVQGALQIADRVIDLNLHCGDGNISEFDGQVKITLEYKLSEAALIAGKLPTVYYVDAAGEKHEIQSKYDKETGLLYFMTDHFSVYTVEDPAAEAMTLRGDVNMDGKVNAEDLTLLAQYHAGAVEITALKPLANADADSNKELTASDLTRLARYIAKIITKLD